MCMFLWGCASGHIIHVCTWGSRSEDSLGVSVTLYLIFWGESLSLDLEIINLTGMAGQHPPVFRAGSSCPSVHRYVQMGARGWHWLSSSATLHLVYWGRFSHLNLELANFASLASQLAPGIPCFCLLRAGITGMGSCVFPALMWVLGLWSTVLPHGCMVRALPPGMLPGLF